MMKKIKPADMKHLGLIAPGSLILGGLFQWVLPIGAFWLGFLSAASLIFICSVVLYLAWRMAGSGRLLGWMMLTAFLLRLVLGVFLTWGLPQFGYDEREQRAGFVFADAFRREENAWALANGEDLIRRAFSDEFVTDQYGGMLALSALVYRIFSPDAYRPALISILAAGVFTLSIPFLAVALKRRFGRKVALWGGWILALYPEGVLLGAAQMREPFYILFFTILFWGAVNWLERTHLKSVIPAVLAASIGLSLFSFRVALPLIGIILFWVWLEETSDDRLRWLRYVGWGLFGLGIIISFFVLRDWMQSAVHWDMIQTLRTSGRLQYQLENLPDWVLLPFVVIYGLFQPVLPAAIADQAPWIWRSLGIFRATGWYALLPLLIYGLFRVWRMVPREKRHLLILMVLFVWGWILVASARAGGDQWDNPRYRTILLPWMAALAGWGIMHARMSADRWLNRWLMVEGIFLAFFTEWYISRYYAVIPRLDFWVMTGLILFLSSLVLVGGWLWDRKHLTKP
jgi:hypothetical protein